MYACRLKRNSPPEGQLLANNVVAAELCARVEGFLCVELGVELIALAHARELVGGVHIAEELAWGACIEALACSVRVCSVSVCAGSLCVYCGGRLQAGSVGSAERRGQALDPRVPVPLDMRRSL